jgi:hypothetical protein
MVTVVRDDLDHMDGEGAGIVVEVPRHRRPGLEPALRAAGGEIAGKLPGVRDRLEHLFHRLRDARRDPKFKLHRIDSSLESRAIML